MKQSEKKYVSILDAVMRLADTGFSVELFPFIDKAIELNNSKALAYVVKGAIFQKEDEFEKAESTYRTALEKEPDSPQALQGLGILLVELERYIEAIPLLINHLRIEPNNNPSIDSLLICFNNITIEDNKKIEEFYKEAWTITKHSEIGIIYARYLLLNTEKLNLAKEIAYEICNTSRNAKILVESSIIFYFDGEYDKAIEILKQASEIEPLFDRPWRGLAQCYIRIGKIEEALFAANKALSIAPNHYQNLQAKTEALIEKGELDSLEEALEIINIVKSTNQGDSLADSDKKPVFRKLYLMEGESLRKLERYEESIKVYNKALDDFPNNIRFLINLFLLYYESNQNDNAWDMLSQKGELDEDLFRIIEGLGVRFFHMGQLNKTLDIYNRLVEYSQNPQFMMHYGYILGSAGRIPQAITASKLVLSQENIDEITRIITYANLAYLYALDHQPSEVNEYSEKIFKSPKKDIEAILHLPFFFSGEMYSDPISIPGRNITVLQAGQACYIAASLKLGHLEKVDPFIPVIQSWDDKKSYKYLILASIYLHNNHNELVKECLDKALDLTEENGEQTMIQTWVSLLEN